jgi:hypothetical protein
MGTAVVVFFPGAVYDLFAGATTLHGDHFAQKQHRDFGRDQPMVGISSHSGKLF